MSCSRPFKVAFSPSLFRAIALALCVGTVTSGGAASGSTGGASASSPRFYPGVSEYQSIRAHEALRAFYNGNMPRAARVLDELDAHEDSENLPPLSRLLMTAMHGLTLQRNDAGGVREAAQVRAAFDSAAEHGLRACGSPAPPRGAGTATCGLIEGGIRGFRAILDLDARPATEVLSEGLSAVSLLEEALGSDSLVRDAHLGLGIFNVMAASNAPRVVRGMLRAAGRGVSLDEGLTHLRRSGYEGQYTSVASQFFLIRFLSPYDDELRREKSEIFRSLRATFPLSPLIPFLQNHEALVFYPDSFYRPRARVNLARTIRAVEARDYAGRRYVQLLKHQYSLLTETPERQYRPDTAFDLGGYAFYPAFIEALKLRREISGVGEGAPRSAADQAEPSRNGAKPVAAPGKSAAGARDADAQVEKVENAEKAGTAEQLKRLAALRKSLMTRLRKTDKTLMSPQNRGLLEWHVGDALRADRFTRKAATDAGPKARGSAQRGEDTAETTSKAAGKSRKPPER